MRATNCTAVLFASGALGRPPAVIRIRQQLVEQDTVDRSARGDATVPIVASLPREYSCASASITMFPGSRIEGNDTLRARARWNHRDIGDPADIERDARAPRMPEEQVIDKRHQRRSLPARRDIARAKIRDNRQLRCVPPTPPILQVAACAVRPQW